MVSNDYVGPERRIKPTSLFNRFMFFGKRTFVPKGIQRFTVAFVDQMSPFVVRCFIAYIILSGIDGIFTYWLVGDGTVGEHNPLLRPLLGDSGNAWVFFMVKNVIVLGGYLLAARFQLFRVLKYVAPASVALYLFLDAYWILILSRRFL